MVSTLTLSHSILMTSGTLSNKYFNVIFHNLYYLYEFLSLKKYSDQLKNYVLDC